MKKILALMFLLCAVFAGAQVPTTPNIGLYIPLHNTPLWDNYMNPNFSMLDNFLSGHATLPRINLGQLGITQYIDYTGTTAPALPAAGFCRMYYDLASNQWTGLNSAGELCSSQNAVGSTGHVGYYASTGRKISPDACTTDGSGNHTCASYTTNGIGTAKIDFPEGTSPGNPSAGFQRVFASSVDHVYHCLTSTGANCFSGLVSSVFGQTGAVPNLSGDVSTAGSSVTTLATVNGSPGSCGDATHVCVVTTDVKGRVTAQTTNAIVGGVSSVFGRSGAVVATLGDYNLALLNGGVAPGSQTYDFQTNTDVVNVVTQAAGDSSIKAASTAFVGAAITNSQQAQVIAAHNYGVKADARWVWDATTTSGSNAISCPNSDCNFTAADDGKICFATNDSPSGAGSLLTGVVILPQGVFTHTAAQTGTCSGGNATATATANALLLWGTDDSTALASAWTAALTACATLALPGVNPNGTGPGAMLVQSAQFNSTATTGCFYAAGTTATSANRQGIGVAGVDVNSTYIIPTPSFDFSTCPTVNGYKSCFLAVPDGINVRDLSIWGAGNSKPASASAQLSTSIVGIAPKNNAQVHHLSIMGWGAQTGATGIGFGLTFGANDFIGDYINVDGAGQTSCHEVPSSNGSALSTVTTYALQCGDASIAALWVDGKSVAGQSLSYTSHGGLFFNGNSGTSGNCNITVSNGGLFYSFGDTLGLGISGQSNGICIGYPATTAGKAWFTGLKVSVNSLTSNGNIVYLNASGNTVTFSNSTFAGTVSGGGAFLKTGATGANAFDLGGNDISGVTGLVYSGSGTVFGSGSITGTLLTTGGVATTSGWGTSPSVSAASGTSVDGNFTVTTGTTASPNPVATVTFPTQFWIAPTCFAYQIGGTQAQAFIQTGAVSATTAAFTWIGTPANGATVQFHYHCWN